MTWTASYISIPQHFVQLPATSSKPPWSFSTSHVRINFIYIIFLSLGLFLYCVFIPPPSIAALRYRPVYPSVCACACVHICMHVSYIIWYMHVHIMYVHACLHAWLMHSLTRLPLTCSLCLPSSQVGSEVLIRVCLIAAVMALHTHIPV